MNKARAQQHMYAQYYLYAVVGLLGVLGCAYMYFVSASIVHVVVRKEIHTEISRMHSTISGLEAAYIEKQHSMSNELASLQGFRPAEEKIFINRTLGTLVFSSNGN